MPNRDIGGRSTFGGNTVIRAQTQVIQGWVPGIPPRNIVDEICVREDETTQDMIEAWAAEHRAEQAMRVGAMWTGRADLIAAGCRHSVACRADGSVVAVGDDAAGEFRVAGWRDVVAVAAGNVHAFANTGKSHTVGLHCDGSGVATGWNAHGQCNIGQWRDVQTVAAEWCYTLGVRRDGHVLAAGRGADGQTHVDGWRSIVAVACGDWHSVGLTSTGNVVGAGNNRAGQLNVTGWHDITGVSAGYLHTLGLDAGGTARAVGRHASFDGVDAWRDVVQVAAGSHHSVGLTRAGRVRASGSNEHGHRQQPVRTMQRPRSVHLEAPTPPLGDARPRR